MLILLAPALIAVLFILSILFFIRHSLIAGAFFLFLSVALNCYTETFPFHFSYLTNDAQQKEDNDQISILTYNIKYKSDYLRHNSDSLSSLLSFFKLQNADILVLPESRLNSTNKRLLALLDELYPYNMNAGFKGNDFYLETYVFSHFPISDVKQYGKHYIYEMNIHISEDKCIKLIACHLVSNQSHSSLSNGEGLLSNLRNGYEMRATEVRLLSDSLRNYLGPTIITGDMNDISGSYTLKHLQKTLNLYDAWWKAGFGYGTTSYSKHLYFRLDHILYSKHFEISTVEVPHVSFSDHYPVRTTLTLPQ